MTNVETGFHCPDCGHHFYPRGAYSQGITRRESRVMACLSRREIENLPPPTFQEIAEAIGRKWKGSIADAVHSLEAKGLITLVPRRTRSITITERGWLLFQPERQEASHA